jgi:hypothetical protein
MEEGLALEAKLEAVEFAYWHLAEGKAYFLLNGELQLSDRISEGENDQVLAYFAIAGNSGGKWELELPTRGVQWSSLDKKVGPRVKALPPAAECRLVIAGGHKSSSCLVLKRGKTKAQVLEIKQTSNEKTSAEVAESIAEQLRAEFDLPAVTDIGDIQDKVRTRARELRSLMLAL